MYPTPNGDNMCPGEGAAREGAINKIPVHKVLVRLPVDLHQRVTEAAERYRRSVNSEIVARLEQSLAGLPHDADESAVEPPFFPYIETTFRRDLSEQENALIRAFRRLSRRQRGALVALLTG